MKIILLRHGAAEEAGSSRPDPERALTDEGRRQAALAGKLIQAALGVPGAFWSSPLRRAVDTARGAMQAMGLATEPKLVTELGPGGDAEHVAWLVHTSGTDPICLVGHQPDLGRFAARLLGLSSEISIRKGGMTIIETGDATRSEGRAIATLAPDLYERILDGREYAPWMRKALRPTS